MLTTEQIKGNTIKFMKLLKSIGIDDENFIKFLNDNTFWLLPATTKKDMYGCYPGGLVDFSLKVTEKMVKMINSDILSDNIKPSRESILKTGLLFGLGKINLFVKNTDNYQINKGILYSFNQDLVSMGVSERSLFYIMSHLPNKLTENEYQAISYHDKRNDNSFDVYLHHNNILSKILNQCIDLTIYELKNTN